jgi:hypothetical protein
MNRIRLITAALLLAACSDDTTATDAGPLDASAVDSFQCMCDAPPVDAAAPDAVPASPLDIDVLFVVDDSLSMAEEQTALTLAFPGFVDASSEIGAAIGARMAL